MCKPLFSRLYKSLFRRGCEVHGHGSSGFPFECTILSLWFAHDEDRSDSLLKVGSLQRRRPVRCSVLLSLIVVSCFFILLNVFLLGWPVLLFVTALYDCMSGLLWTFFFFHVGQFSIFGTVKSTRMDVVIRNRGRYGMLLLVVILTVAHQNPPVVTNQAHVVLEGR